jgi:hypothetical protein
MEFLTPTTIGTGAGAIIGGLYNKDDPMKGAIAGGLFGGLAGYMGKKFFDRREQENEYNNPYQRTSVDNYNETMGYRRTGNKLWYGTAVAAPLVAPLAFSPEFMKSWTPKLSRFMMHPATRWIAGGAGIAYGLGSLASNYWNTGDMFTSKSDIRHGILNSGDINSIRKVYYS